MPKRARSYFGPPVVIISIAQQARPKVAGQNDALRMYPATPSTVVSRTPLGSFSSMPIQIPPAESREARVLPRRRREGDLEGGAVVDRRQGRQGACIAALSPSPGRRDAIRRRRR